MVHSVKKLLERLDKFGLVGLTYWEHGFRPVTNNKHPITKLEDFQGLKLRTIPFPIFVDIYKQLGANPVPMGFTELFNRTLSKKRWMARKPVSTQ
jgi:TRAP-type C4-dicarboxylate transport system substrate-binding protein